MITQGKNMDNSIVACSFLFLDRLTQSLVSRTQIEMNKPPWMTKSQAYGDQVILDTSFIFCNIIGGARLAMARLRYDSCQAIPHILQSTQIVILVEHE